jgi:hypothetical protein
MTFFTPYILIYQKNREIVKYDAQVELFMIEGREYRQLSDHLGMQYSPPILSVVPLGTFRRLLILLTD